MCETAGCKEQGMMGGKYRHCKEHLRIIVRASYEQGFAQSNVRAFEQQMKSQRNEALERLQSRRND